MNDKLLPFIGIAKKAGKLSLGNDSVKNAIYDNKAKLIVFSSDISPNTRKKLDNISEEKNVPVLNINRTKEEIAFSIGKECVVLSVNDENFANKISKLIIEEDIG